LICYGNPADVKDFNSDKFTAISYENANNNGKY